ncbi:hypothetical protein BDZ97DRAFT_1815996 [Flammula alnicola]|nr:hypothetical protein BDZ97DRAFT_1815996 [Flammula alnicola]
MVNTLNTTFSFLYIYRSIIIFFENPDYVLDVNWLTVIDPITSALIIFFVQVFFAWRTYALTNNWVSSTVIAITAVASVVGGILLIANFSLKPTFFQVDGKDNKIFMILWLLAGVICNMSIVSSKMWYLHTNKHKFSSSDLLVDHIVRVVVRTGLLALMLATIDFLVYIGCKDNGVHLVFNMPLCKVYSCIFMSILNSRHGWPKSRRSIGSIFSQSNVRNNTNMTPREDGPGLEFASFGSMEVSVHVELHRQVDSIEYNSSMSSTLAEEPTANAAPEKDHCRGQSASPFS